jgi:hypothetical protein
LTNPGFILLVTVNIGPNVYLAFSGGIVCPTLKQSRKRYVETIQHTMRPPQHTVRRLSPSASNTRKLVWRLCLLCIAYRQGRHIVKQ